MSEDDYVEWLVKRKDPGYVVPVKILMIVLCIFSMLTVLQTVLGVIIMLVVGAAIYFVFFNMSVEYEYLFTEGGLSVDHIMRRVRRKRVFDCDKEDAQIVAPADSFVLRDYERQRVKVKDFSSDHRGARVRTMVYQKGAENYEVLFEPNEKMAGAMRRAYPCKVVVRAIRYVTD